MALLEAMSKGMPCIATNVGAVSEVFNNTNGRIVEPGNLDQLSEAIEQLAYCDLEPIFRSNYKLSKEFTLQSFFYKTTSFIKHICSDDERN